MWKNIYFISLAGMLILSTIIVSAQDISVSLLLPEQAQAGDTIPVKVVIHKGTHSDFARFKQKIPPGFEVEPGQLANSDFTFKDREVNFIWLKLPPQEDIILEYTLIPDFRLHGIFRISGLFSYVNNGEREEVAVPEKSITILTSPEVSAQGTAAETPMGNQQIISSGLVVYRQQPEKAKDGSGWIVRILVKRGFVKKLARVEETIPSGYIAENIDGKGSIFSYRSGKLKFIWMTMPEDTILVVAYKLVPMDKNVPEPPLVTGTFSYMLNDRPVSKIIIPVQEKIPLHASGKEYASLLAKLDKTTESQMTAETSAKPLQKSNTEGSTQTATVLTTPPSSSVSQEKKPAGNREETKIVSENKPGQPMEIVQHPASAAEGIYFRVQVLATRNPVQIERYIRKHHIPGKIYREEVNGLFKYTTGIFALYKDARAFVRHMKETTDIDSAFVTAYDNGKRISVREALDRTGQKWFK
ncbi:MAG TPA: hypothetical protein ENK25_04605 [Bacteroidetes bacterium]|nr:hypothetical protein [Bacteroidota bacterium]